MGEEDYKEQRSRTLFYIGFVVLTIISIGTIISSSNPMGAFATFIVLWWITIVLVRNRHFIAGWFNSDRTVKEYIAERKTNHQQTRQVSFDNVRQNTMDGDSNSPLTSAEETEWNNIVSALNSDDK